MKFKASQKDKRQNVMKIFFKRKNDFSKSKFQKDCKQKKKQNNKE